LAQQGRTISRASARLGAAAREIAQVGAAIGRDFTYELLAAMFFNAMTAIFERRTAKVEKATGQLLAVSGQHGFALVGNRSSFARLGYRPAREACNFDRTDPRGLVHT
jgi:hypothetical protein